MNDIIVVKEAKRTDPPQRMNLIHNPIWFPGIFKDVMDNAFDFPTVVVD